MNHLSKQKWQWSEKFLLTPLPYSPPSQTKVSSIAKISHSHLDHVRSREWVTWATRNVASSSPSAFNKRVCLCGSSTFYSSPFGWDFLSTLLLAHNSAPPRDSLRGFRSFPDDSALLISPSISLRSKNVQERERQSVTLAGLYAEKSLGARRHSKSALSPTQANHECGLNWSLRRCAISVVPGLCTYWQLLWCHFMPLFHALFANTRGQVSLNEKQLRKKIKIWSANRFLKFTPVQVCRLVPSLFFPDEDRQTLVM